MNQELRDAIRLAIYEATVEHQDPPGRTWERRAEAAVKTTIDWIEERMPTAHIGVFVGDYGEYTAELDDDARQAVMAWMREATGL